MNFYSANGNLIKKNVEGFNNRIIESLEQTQNPQIETSENIQITNTPLLNNNFIQINSSQNSNDNTLTIQIEKTVESIRNSMVKDCNVSPEEAQRAIYVVKDADIINPNVHISTSFIVGNTNNDQDVEKKTFYESSISAFMDNADIRKSCLLDKMMKLNKEINCLSSGFSCKEKECKAAGYTSCINKKEEEEEEACKEAGFYNCANKKIEESCKAAGYNSCVNKKEEEDCKAVGYNSCVHKAEEEASGLSNNLILIIGLLIVLYFLFNKSN